MVNIETKLAAFSRVAFVPWMTPLERQPRLSEELGYDFYMKRDDLTGIAFGGNKVRQLEYYFGEALQQDADTILITGAVQSNFVRTAAACAARLGLQCHVQLEERVADVDRIYRKSGNVLLNELLGAHVHSFDRGEDEAGADAALEAKAEALRAEGRKPYVIHLAMEYPPLGALGYVRAAGELLSQGGQFDTVVLGSGSGQTHSGMLFGLRAHGWLGPVFGICVRREAEAQKRRIMTLCEKIAVLVGCSCPVSPNDVQVFDDWLAPGYGTMNASVADAIRVAARTDGAFVDPVYTARVFAGVIGLTKSGDLRPSSPVVMVHTGGLPALFGYETALREWVLDR